MSTFNELQGHKMNEGHISDFCKHFIYKNFVMNFKISGFVGFTGWICNLDFVKVSQLTHLLKNGYCSQFAFFVHMHIIVIIRVNSWNDHNSQ